MCYRFCIEKDDEGIQRIVSVAERSSLAERFMVKLSKPLVTSGDVRPTDVAAVIAPGRSKNRSVFPMKWGFTLKGSSGPLVNARTETASGKPTFREAWASHRCVVPASFYYEWEHFRSPDGKVKTGNRYSIQPAGSTMAYLCGLYRFEGDWPVFTILTCAPPQELARIHDRMPLILPEERVDEWISPDSRPEELLPYALKDMVFEKS
ncbi:MAG: SOS response-associated peptidase [Lachnospiraceae bacterium]|nr:SOS response-associated peptidase [Lachnospiraceae bacterium]